MSTQPQQPHGLSALGEPEHTPSALVEAIAQRTAELVIERLTGSQPAGLVDARAVATALGYSVEWVRDHADELGVVRKGNGPKPRLRFDLARALASSAARSGSGRSQPSDSPKPSARRRQQTPRNVELVPIRSPNGGRGGDAR